MDVNNMKNILIFGAERRVRDTVYLSLQTHFFVERRESSASCSEMRMVVHAEENVRQTVVAANRSEESSHWFCPFFFAL